MAIAYQYDASGYFIGENEDYGLLPNNATYTVPEVKSGYIPCWQGEKWQQIEDHKGEEGYVHGEPFTIKEYGPLPDGWTKTPPPPSLEKAKASKLMEINAAFTQAEKTGIILSSVGFHIDANERANRDTEGLITFMEFKGESTTYFCGADNTMYQVSLDDIKTMRLEIIAQGQKLYNIKWALREEINKASSIEELQDVTWPEEE